MPKDSVNFKTPGGGFYFYVVSCTAAMELMFPLLAGHLYVLLIIEHICGYVFI